MSFGHVLALGVLVAVIGFGLQGVYLPQSIGDLRDRRRRTRADMALATSAADRESTRREGRAVVFFCAARIISSLALMTVHLLIVSTIALVLRASRSEHPSAIAFELAWIRVAVSAVVIVSTASQLAARWWAIRR